jgi:hypothetical protein
MESSTLFIGKGSAGPDQNGRVGFSLVQKQFQKSFQKNCDFPTYFNINFNWYWIVFLYYKDINSVLKYPVFFEILQKHII